MNVIETDPSCSNPCATTRGRRGTAGRAWPAWGLVVLATAVGACDAPDTGMLENALEDAPAYKALIKERTLTITGTAADSHLALRLLDAATLAVDVNDDGTVDFAIDRATFDRITIQAGAGDDVVRMDESNGVFTDTQLVTIFGGKGNDTLIGGIGPDTFHAGPGDDVVTGGRGADAVFLGGGADTFTWNPGDGSDVVDGEGGDDVVLFNGSNVGEQIELTADGDQVLLQRNVGLVTMSMGRVERVDIGTRGGADQVIVHDLTGTGAPHIHVNLESIPGSGTGDMQADQVVIEGTPGADRFDVAGDGADVLATGLGATVSVTGGEPAIDALVVHGDAGDLVNVNGSPGADNMVVAESSGHALVSVDGFNVMVDASGMDKLAINGLGGDDVLRQLNGQNPLPVQLDGGEGDDQLQGGNFADLLLGGPGDDVISGGQGADNVSLGSGNDTFVWNPGDGSDVVEGEAGADTLVFNGSNIGEEMELGANGRRLRLLRNVGQVAMDLGGLEQVDINARGGADRVTVHDLTGTGAPRVNVNLESIPGSGAGDTQPDVVVIEGTANPDHFDIAADGAAVVATGIKATVSVTGGELAIDSLAVSAAGDDLVNVNGSPEADNMLVAESGGHALVSVAGFNVTVDASGMARLAVNGLGGDDVIHQLNGQNQLPVQLDGGEGSDQLQGGNFADVLLGGPGDDVIAGGQGADTISMGEGNDTFVWNPGDGSDTVEGEAGNDTMVFNASNIGEEIELGAVGRRLRVLRNIGLVTLDVRGIESVDVVARGGADRVLVHDLAGTGVGLLQIDLASTPGAGVSDAQPDVVIVEGTGRADQINVVSDGGTPVVTGLSAVTRVSAPDPFDQLVVNGLGGVDIITADPGLENIITLMLNQN